MKRIAYFSIALISMAILSCQKDPLSEVESGSWNRGRSILEIRFQGQAGTPTITNVDGSTGIIDLSLATNLVPDLSAVKVELLTLSYKAGCSVNTGGTIDFTAASPTIEVIAVSGEKRTYTLNMEEFTENLVGSYRIATSRIWGGTGPMYGGGAVIEPGAKPWCWDTKGFGPEAEYDDFLEFTLDEITADGNTTGKCVHYGGADGKHWNCIFAASMNKEGKTAIDLHKFYRQIPVGTSTWYRNYSDGTLSFTDAAGKVTSCTIVEAGTHEIYNESGYTAKVTVDEQAFKFDLAGTDDWTNIYSDYDKFVKRPRAFYVMVSKVDAIPDASKTEGTEGDISIEEPVPEPEAPIDGTYRLTRHTVYGGSVDPAFVNPVDKSWMWNSSVYRESDNMLVITVSGTTEKGVTGTCDYQAGDDGQYWDHIMLADKNKLGTGALDLSRYYGLLPHGECSYVYDPSEGSITLTSGIISVKANFLKAGTYKFGEKDLTVAGIALDFPLPGYTVQGPWPWTDFDRFAYGPRNYVMLFEKVVTE